MISEVAQIRQQITEQEQSARFGLYGPAIMASHDAIIARMELGGEYLLQLFKTGREQEALKLWQEGILE
jgi:hypothetical protein